MPTDEHVDPEVAAMVEAIRDRFGLSGLRAAAKLIDEEIVRVNAVTEATFAAEE